MNRRPTLRSSLWLLTLLFCLTGCSPDAPQMLGPAGTPEMREALFDSILAMTARRTAFSVPKKEALGFDPLEEMEKLRGDVVGAETEDELFDALLRLSNARRDRHLSVGLVDSGLRPTFTDGLEVWSGPEVGDALEAPVRFRPDFGEGGFFVSDVASQVGSDANAVDEPEFEKLAIGDRVVAINGIQSEDLQKTLVPYFRYSSIPGLRWKIAEALSLRTALLPPTFIGEVLDLVIERADGSRITTSLPYFETESLTWTGTTEPAYPGYEIEWSTPTYDLYLPSEGQRNLILQWHRFESSSLLEDVDRLVAFGEENGLLDHAIIFDATRSGGGSLGAYAVQRIQPKPFKTTFGTLRLSDVIEPFVQDKREDFEAQRIYDGGGPETVDDGTWLMDWIENDLVAALENGDSVTVPVPFKLAHAPKDSDGVLQPAPVHFRGPLVVFLGPNGGSHLDQFISIVADNDLGHIMGMPPGGYSNTWEWGETLFFPGTYQPVVGFMWNIGHTIRPNGEVLEGNPAPLDESIPLTAGNATRYYEILMERAGEYLRSIGFGADPS
jgi:hypothetical protein